jgi:RNA polymerase sigma-70 factor, ECF subfamily
VTPLASAAEATVITLACTGDPLAFEELVRRRQSHVRNFMHYLCRRTSERDDLAQQVFLTAWRSIRHLRSPVAFDSWLRRIMVTTWLEAVRRNKLDFANEQSLAENTAGDDSTAERLDLNSALAELAPPMRLCVVLAYEVGMTHEEICDVTDMPLGTVKSNINRGSQRLRELLSAYRSRSAANG